MIQFIGFAINAFILSFTNKPFQNSSISHTMNLWKGWISKKESFAIEWWFLLGPADFPFFARKRGGFLKRNLLLMIFAWKSRFCIFSRKKNFPSRYFFYCKWMMVFAWASRFEILLFTRNDDAFLQGIRLRLIELHFIQRNLFKNMILKNWYQGKNSKC